MNLFFRIANETANNKKSIDRLRLASWCNNNSNTSVSLEKHFDAFIIDFNQMKIWFSSNERRSLRQKFLHLAKECIKLKDFGSATIITENLADSAYKLPYCKLYKYMRLLKKMTNVFPLFLAPSFQTITKSSTYLMIEKALVQNKQNVARFLKNSSLVYQLRKEADHLILKLTYEIQKEMKEQYNPRYQEKVRKFSKNF